MTLERRIRGDIEARIQSGALRPGDRIPFEHELTATYGCARATVSKALTGLARAGLIERRRKAGSFVAHPHVQTAVLEVPDLEKLITARGGIYRWQRTQRNLTSDPKMGGPTLRIEGVHYCGAEGFALETRLISLTTVPAAAAQEFGTEAPGGWLLARVPWTRARHAISARAATLPEARALGIAPGTACLAITRCTWQVAGGVDAPVTRVSQLFPGDRYDLVAEFNPAM